MASLQSGIQINFDSSEFTHCLPDLFSVLHKATFPECVMSMIKLAIFLLTDIHSHLCIFPFGPHNPTRQ
jgi:hypothetical protein